MNELGFMIDKEGRITFFGKWVHYSEFRTNDRRLSHSFSFEDEVLNTDYFKLLNLLCNRKEGELIYKVAFDFSHQGIILFFNSSIESIFESGVMYSPIILTDFQKESLSKLYETIKAYEEIEINIGPKDKNIFYTSIDDYFDNYGIDRNSNLNKL